MSHLMDRDLPMGGILIQGSLGQMPAAARPSTPWVRKNRAAIGEIFIK
jgi:hypothetical protein